MKKHAFVSFFILINIQNAYADQSFDFYNEGSVLFSQKKWSEACEKLYESVLSSSGSEDWSETAQYMLGECLQNLDLNHASLVFFTEVVKNRKRPSLLSKSLEHIQTVSQSTFINEDTLYIQFLSEISFGEIPEKSWHMVQYAYFINALYKNNISWANNILFSMNTDNFYTHKALYAMAVYDIKNGKDDIALEKMHDLIKMPSLDKKSQETIYLSMARILFENKQYAQALEYYNELNIQDISYKSAFIILEKSWCYFYLQEYNNVLNTIETLYSTVYEGFILPEKFLLRALVYSENCHFLRARHDVDSYRTIHAEHIHKITHTPNLEEVYFLHIFAKEKTPLKKTLLYSQSVLSESQKIGSLFKNKNEHSLHAFLEEFYKNEIQNQKDTTQKIRKDIFFEAASEFIKIQELIDILEYEIFDSIDTNAHSQNLVVPQKIHKNIVSHHENNVFFPFDEEYWLDEIYGYEFQIANACSESSKQ